MMPPIERTRSGSRIWVRSKFTRDEAVSLSLRTGRLVLQKRPVLRLCKLLVPTDSLLVRFTIAQVASSVLPAEYATDSISASLTRRVSGFCPLNDLRVSTCESRYSTRRRATSWSSIWPKMRLHRERRGARFRPDLRRRRQDAERVCSGVAAVESREMRPQDENA